MADLTLTIDEQQAIKSLQRIAKKWPKTLELFSWSGSLTIFKVGNDGRRCSIDSVDGIPNDGGDPDDINQSPEIDYE